jgi:hypothetical protein
MKADSLRTQQAISRFGKSARHPLCLAALDLWQLDAELLTRAKEIGVLAEVTSSAKKQKKQARALLDQFYKEEKQKDAIEAAALVRKIDEHLLETQTAYQATVKLRSIYQEFLPGRVALFECERDAVVRTGGVKASRALQRVRKRWNTNPKANGARLKDGDRRTFEILKMLRDKVINAAWAKDGAIAGYTEAALGGDRLLSDEAWQGRLTAREIHSRLMAVGGSRLAGDKDAKEIRRLLKRLGIRPAEDQQGRKWKPPNLAKQEPKRPRGRPRTKPKIVFTGLEAVEAKIAAPGDGLRNQQIYEVRQKSDLKRARQDLRSIDREIARLVLRRGGRRGRFVY